MFCVPPMFFPVMPIDLQHRCFFFLCSQVRVRPLMVSFSVSCMVSCMVVSCTVVSCMVSCVVSCVVSCTVSCTGSCAISSTFSCAISCTVSCMGSCIGSCIGSWPLSVALKGFLLVGPLTVLLRQMFCVPPMFFPVVPLDLQHR